MTQSEEVPAEQSVPVPTAPEQSVPAVPSAPEQSVPLVPAVPVLAVLSEEELAAAAAKKAKRRKVVGRTVTLVLPTIALVGLLIGTGTEANSLTSKTNAASDAAKSAHVADGLVAQLRAAQTAADASILVDPGCIAIESKTTANLEDKLIADDNSLYNAEKGTSFSAFTAAANADINDLQSLSTTLQQDGALSKRQAFKSAVSTLTGDLTVVISAMQQAMSGNYSTSSENSLTSAANRMDGDSTVVDTLCGGTTLNGGGSGSSSSNGSGTTSA